MYNKYISYYKKNTIVYFIKKNMYLCNAILKLLIIRNLISEEWKQI